MIRKQITKYWGGGWLEGGGGGGGTCGGARAPARLFTVSQPKHEKVRSKEVTYLKMFENVDGHSYKQNYYYYH